MPVELMKLPYAADALEPHIDKTTMEIHHGKHHNTYVTNYNKALEQAPQRKGINGPGAQGRLMQDRIGPVAVILGVEHKHGILSIEPQPCRHVQAANG